MPISFQTEVDDAQLHAGGEDAFDPRELEIARIERHLPAPAYEIDLLACAEPGEFGSLTADHSATTNPDTQENSVTNGGQCAARVSDTLALIAGPYAQALAQIDPFPHTLMMTLPKGRLHLLAFLLANGTDPDKAKAMAVEPRHWPGKTYRDLPGKRLAQRMTLPLWDQQAYQALAECLQHEVGKRYVAHGDVVSPTRAKVFVALPDELRLASVAHNLYVEDEAVLLKEVLQLLRATDLIHHKAALTVLQASSREEFYTRLAELVSKRYRPTSKVEQFGPQLKTTLLPGYTQICSNKMLAEMGRTFKNCLANYQDELVNGETAFILRDGSPMVVIGIKPNISGGYMLWQMEAPRGDEVVGELREQILDELLQMSITTETEWHDRLSSVERGFRALASQTIEQAPGIRRNALRCAEAAKDARDAFKWTGRHSGSRVPYVQ